MTQKELAEHAYTFSHNMPLPKNVSDYYDALKMFGERIKNHIDFEINTRCGGDSVYYIK